MVVLSFTSSTAENSDSLRLQAGPAPPRFPLPTMPSEAPKLLLSLALVCKSLQEQLSFRPALLSQVKLPGLPVLRSRKRLPTLSV